MLDETSKRFAEDIFTRASCFPLHEAAVRRSTKPPGTSCFHAVRAEGPSSRRGDRENCQIEHSPPAANTDRWHGQHGTCTLSKLQLEAVATWDGERTGSCRGRWESDPQCKQLMSCELRALCPAWCVYFETQAQIRTWVDKELKHPLILNTNAFVPKTQETFSDFSQYEKKHYFWFIIRFWSSEWLWW